MRVIPIRRLLVATAFLTLSLAAQNGKKGDLEAGKSVFKDKCAECHFADSKEVKLGPGLQGVKDGKLPSGQNATHDTILELLNNGRDAMPEFKDSLTDLQKENVIAYVMTL